MYNSTIIVEDFNTLLWILDKTTKDQHEGRKCGHSINSLNLKMTIEHSTQHENIHSS